MTTSNEIAKTEVLQVHEVEEFLSIWDEAGERNVGTDLQAWMSFPIVYNNDDDAQEYDGEKSNRELDTIELDTISTENTANLNGTFDEEKNEQSSRARRAKRNIMDDCSVTTEDTSSTGGIDDLDRDVDGKGKNKARKSRGINTRRVKGDAESLDPWIMTMCQMPIALCNAINNGDSAKVGQLVDEYMKSDVVFNECRYSQDVDEDISKLVHRVHGSDKMAQNFKHNLYDNPDLIADLKEVKLKKSDSTSDQECMVFKMVVTVTRYGHDLRSFQEMMDGDAPKERAACSLVDKANLPTFSKLMEMEGNTLDDAERRRLDALHEEALIASRSSNFTDATPIVVKKVVVTHCYFDKSPTDQTHPHKCINEMFRDSKVQSVTRSSLKSAGTLAL